MSSPPSPRPRAREHGLVLDRLPTGPLNAVTDVGDVRVGHVTLWEGADMRTGVTAIVPHGGNLFRDKVPGACTFINAFGKAIGTAQLAELGTIETPIVLSNTLAMGVAFDGIVSHALAGNPEIGRTAGTVNPIAAECNDGYLNDIRARHIRPEHVVEAIERAEGGPVREGIVGAGTGMMAYGWKAGIGTASRRTDEDFLVGVLVLANFGAAHELTIGGVHVGRTIAPPREAGAGSCIVIIATDAPVDARQLGRMARRAQNGLARTGTVTRHSSGDFAFAFSTAQTISEQPAGPILSWSRLSEGALDGLFQGVVEATEEAVVNALLVADTVEGRDGHIAYGLPVDEVLRAVGTRPG